MEFDSIIKEPMYENNINNNNNNFKTHSMQF